jgi:hypothetical protein
MKHLSRQLIIIVGFLLSFTTSNLADEPSKVLGVGVKSEKKNVTTLVDIEKQVAETLKKRYSNFDPGISPNVSFDPNSSREFITFTYISNVGKPYWRACLNKKLKVTKIETGIAVFDCMAER